MYKSNRLRIEFIITAIVLMALIIPFNIFSAENAKTDKPKTISVSLANGDHVSAEEITLAEGKLSIKLPYAGTIQVGKEQVLSLVFPAGMSTPIGTETVENDTIYTLKGEVLSGSIISIDKTAIKLMPSYAPEKTSTVLFDKVSYCMLKKEKGAVPTVNDPDLVKIIFVNGDLLTGKITGLTDGKFTFQTNGGAQFAFAPGQYQTIHNAATSKQFIEGGLAAALLNVLRNADNIRSYGNYLFITLVRGFIKSNDIDGAVYIFDHMSDFSVEPYIYQQLAEEFNRSQLYDLALKAYRIVLDTNPRNVYDYDRIIDVYVKLDKKGEAAEVCEKFLEQKENLVNYGRNPIDLHLRAADLYKDVKNYAKATEHLQTIITDPNSKEYKRSDARQKLIDIYKEQGQLDKLISNYRKQLDVNEKAIGDGMLLLIEKYAEQGRLTKAKYEFERLKQFGLTDYVAKAEQIISKMENTNPEDED
jgi:pentatricopeptide repeat protein